MARVLLLGALACVACRMLTGRWPWDFLRASERAQQEAMARTLLGVSRQASREEIVDAHRKLIARVHPDRGGESADVHAANAARDLLLARVEESGKP